MAVGPWPGADLELRVSKRRWRGLTDDGFGHLEFCDLVATSRGRGAAVRPRSGRSRTGRYSYEVLGDGQADGVVRSGARGEFGGLTPVRPATGKLVVCLRGHRLDLDLYDKLKPYSHRYRLHGTLCEVCRAQEG
ncbi:hypothetical protein ACWED2_10080 [Amycolatopsis sp. NPDC005003]